MLELNLQGKCLDCGEIIKMEEASIQVAPITETRLSFLTALTGNYPWVHIFCSIPETHNTFHFTGKGYPGVEFDN